MRAWRRSTATCELDKRGLACTTALSASTGEHRRYSLVDLGRSCTVAKMVRSDAANPFACAADVGPAYCFPDLAFNTTRREASVRNEARAQPRPAEQQTAVPRFVPDGTLTERLKFVGCA